MKVAIVLFNLGGPDRPEAIQPFLQNLFSDPAIIGAPGPIRWILARWISRKRAPIAKEIYKHLGGKSPLLGLTEDQARALEADCQNSGDTYKAFIAMRYWHPMGDETAEAVKEFAPDKIVLLPLYPQFSTTTTGSSIDDWKRAAAKAGLNAPTAAICCYPDEPGFIDAMANATREAIEEASKTGKPRVLFSAHGLPKKIVDGGDPYPGHVEQTAKAIADQLDVEGLDWVVCYQSRVGPLEWIGPATEDEIARAGRDEVPIVMVPIAFVSEHSETLVELDIEYKELAEAAGAPSYTRVSTVCSAPSFIQGLKNLTLQACETIKEGDTGATVEISSSKGGCICPSSGTKCPNSKGV